MSTLILVGVMCLAAMIIVLTHYSGTLIEGQRDLKANFIKKRKMSLYNLSLKGETNKELIKTIDKGFFKSRRDKIENLLFKADMKITYAEYLIICFTLGVIGWFIGGFFNNLATEVVIAILMFTLPKSYLQFVCESLKKEINEQLEPALSQIIGLLPAKKTLPNAVEACVGNMEEPLKTFFTGFVNNINNANRSFEDEISELARKIDSKPFNDFARLAVVNYRQGGETMYAFSSIPEAMRDIKMVQSEQESELDSLRLLGYMFVLLGPLSYFYYYFTDKNNFDILVNTFAGKVITVIALVITLITIKLIIRISKPVEL